MKPSSRLLAVFGAGLILGLGGETLLFLKKHCSGVENFLREDFRVLAFLRSDLEAGRLKVLEEKLRALDGVDEVQFVSRDEAMWRLRQEAPELVEAVTWLGESPLPPAFEIILSPESLGRLPQWLEAASSLSEWVELRYKGAQVRAILQFRFYGRFIALILGAAFSVAMILCLPILLREGGLDAFQWRRDLAAAGTAAAGAGLGMAAACLAAYPLHGYLAWWSLPGPCEQGLLLAASGALGWVLWSCQRPD